MASVASIVVPASKSRPSSAESNSVTNVKGPHYSVEVAEITSKSYVAVRTRSPDSTKYAKPWGEIVGAFSNELVSQMWYTCKFSYSGQLKEPGAVKTA